MSELTLPPLSALSATVHDGTASSLRPESPREVDFTVDIHIRI